MTHKMLPISNDDTHSFRLDDGPPGPPIEPGDSVTFDLRIQHGPCCFGRLIISRQIGISDAGKAIVGSVDSWRVDDIMLDDLGVVLTSGRVRPPHCARRVRMRATKIGDVQAYFYGAWEIYDGPIEASEHCASDGDCGQPHVTDPTDRMTGNVDQVGVDHRFDIAVNVDSIESLAPQVHLVVAQQDRVDGSTKVIVGHATTREAAQSWINILGFEMDVFRGRMAAWLRDHPEPNPIHADDWVLPIPNSEVDRRERRWYLDRHDAEEEMRRGMLCPLGARASMSDDPHSSQDGPPDYRVEVSRRLD